MISLAVVPVALAELTNERILQTLRRSFLAETGKNELMPFLVAAVLALGAILITFRVMWRHRRPEIRRQLDYLGGGARLLGLHPRERREIESIARQAGVSFPLSILLSPGNLAGALHRLPAASMRQDRLERLDALCRRLFGEPLPAPPPAGTVPPSESNRLS